MKPKKQREARQREFESRMMRWISKLSDREFAEWFYRVVADRNTSDCKEWKGHFVLADAEQVTGEPWDIDFIGLAEDPDDVQDPSLCQSSPCGRCGTPVRSACKRAVCPVCGSPVYCT